MMDKGQMRYHVRYNGEIMARVKYWYDADMLYQSLVTRGKETENVFPFVCELIDIHAKDISQRYETAHQFTKEQEEQMIKEYGR